MHPSGSPSRRRTDGRRARRGAVLLLALLVIGATLAPACRATRERSGSRPDVDARAALAFAQGVEARRRGEPDLALSLFRESIASAPLFVGAHRELQNLLTGLCRPGDVFAEYRALAESRPDVAEHRYLLGRLLGSPEAQRREFRLAVMLDDSLAWGHHGLAVLAEADGRLEAALEGYDRAIGLEPQTALFHARRGETLRRLHRFDEAEAALRRAIDLDPGDADAHAGLALLLELVGRPDAALEACEAAVAALADPSPVLGRYREILRESGSSSDFRRAVETLTRAAERRPAREPLVRHLGLLRRDLGEDDLAVRLLESALAAGGDPTLIVPELRPLHVKAGRFVRAAELTETTVPAHVRDDPGSVVRERNRAPLFWASAAERAPADVDVLLSLARAYEDAGFLEESLLVSARAQLLSPERAEAIEADRRRTETARLAIDRVRDRFREIYRRYLETGDGPGLEQVLVEIGSILDETVGERASAGDDLVRIRTFPLLGSVTEMESGALAPRIPAFFSRFNHYLLVGRREGGPVEGYLTRMAAWIPERRTRLWGADIDHELVIGDGVRLPSFREYLGDGIGGFALDRTAVVNLEAALAWERSALSSYRRFAKDPDRLFSDAIVAARTAEERTALDHPLCLDLKLNYLALGDLPGGGRPSGGREADLSPYLGAIERHEVGHLFDARRYLPAERHPFAVLALLFGAGFSAPRVEARLEGNAELAALVHAPSARLVLSEMASFLPARGSGGAHGRGYVAILREMVDIVAAHPANYPLVDSALPILPQLFKLGEDEIRDLGRRVARGRGLAGD